MTVNHLALVDALSLRKEYGTWGDHPDFPVSDWQDEVMNDETRLGYWDWVEIKIDCENEDED